MIIIILITAIAFVLYETLKGTGTANQAPVTPYGVNSFPNIEDEGSLPPLDISGEPMITYDESTWPSGDKIWNICRAIAVAEGANKQGSNPDRLNNPGDISDGAGTFGFENHSGSNITTFPDKDTGWKWLYRKINNILLGNSNVYTTDMTWTQFAQKYAGNWQPWVEIVTGRLGVTPDEKIGDY